MQNGGQARSQGHGASAGTLLPSPVPLAVPGADRALGFSRGDFFQTVRSAAVPDVLPGYGGVLNSPTWP